MCLFNNGYLHFIQQKGEIANKVFSLDIELVSVSVCIDKCKKYNTNNKKEIKYLTENITQSPGIQAIFREQFRG